MTTASADTTDLSEHTTSIQDQDLISTPGTIAQATLVPTADNMNMEHIFFSIKHLEARITQLEQNNAQMEDNGINPARLQELGLMTRAEHEQEISQLWEDHTHLAIGSSRFECTVWEGHHYTGSFQSTNWRKSGDPQHNADYVDFTSKLGGSISLRIHTEQLA